MTNFNLSGKDPVSPHEDRLSIGPHLLASQGHGKKKQIPDPTDPKQSKHGFTNGNTKHHKTISFNTSKLRRNPKIDPEAIRVFGEPRSLEIIDKFPKTLAPPRFQIPLRSMPQKTATHARPGKRIDNYGKSPCY